MAFIDRIRVDGTDYALYDTGVAQKAGYGHMAEVETGREGAAMRSVCVTIPVTQSGSGDPSPSNVRPFVGFTQVLIQNSGKNLLPNLKNGTTTKSVAMGQSVSYVNFQKICMAAGTYTLSVKTAENVTAQLYYMFNGKAEPITSSLAANPSATFTLAESGMYAFYVYNGSGLSPSDVLSFQLESSLVATDHEAYTGAEYTYSLGENPVYSGVVDLVAGTLTVTGAITTIGALSWTYESTYGRMTTSGLKNSIKKASNNGVKLEGLACSAYLASSSSDTRTINGTIGVTTAGNIYVRDTDYTDADVWKQAFGDQTIVYPLATPVVVELTPQEITALGGLNLIRADAGDVVAEVPVNIVDYVNAEIEAGMADIDVEIANVDARKVDIPDENDILEANQDREALLPNFIRKPILTNKSDAASQPEPLVLAHITDVHGSQSAVERFIEWCGAHSEIIDDMLLTGDIAQSHGTDDITFFTNVEGHEDILLTLGNHDQSSASDSSGSDNGVSEADAYDKFFAPFIANWGVTYTADSANWYKDYTDAGIRLIGMNTNYFRIRQTIDGVVYDREQPEIDAHAAWLATVLEDARGGGLSVVIAQHYPVPSPEKIICNFTTLDSTNIYGGIKIADAYMAAVKTFIDAGGKFICWLGGHTHCDYVLKSTTAAYANQLCIIGTTGRIASVADNLCDTVRTAGTRHQDAFNLVAIDTTAKVIKLLRIGANGDIYQRGRNGIAIKYDTQEIISQF